jgi:uncharacterized protein YxeA
MKKSLLTILVLVVLISVLSLIAYAYSNGEQNIDPAIKKAMSEAEKYQNSPVYEFNEEWAKEGDKRELMNDNPEPIFKNSPNADSYFDIESRIDYGYLKSVGASVVVKEIMTYSDYLKQFNDDELTAISADCKIWVLQVYYPNGFETKRGLFKDATVTGIYDAVTGYYHGFSVDGICDEIIIPAR